MADREVQVFDGEGVIPPELKKLMEENESLHITINKLRKEEHFLNEIINTQAKDIEHLTQQLKSIKQIIATPRPSDDYPKSKDYPPMEHDTDFSDWMQNPGN